ncbi:uncharacterized protein LOC107627359 [Arachis ipaensis]|uniref:uncharacterized protein LOC107627359 n=1 Tax=Arachis ipaensis TaxID=130454 RepID=UPI000A2B6A5C|nr:uncharacterized protein LOC107627359 [Arachis ipaensis]
MANNPSSDPEINQTPDSEFSPVELQSLARILSKLSNMQLSRAKSSANFLSDPSSVYYLHPGENLGISIVTITLNTQNYNSWSRAMRLALKSKNKLGFIDETIQKSNKNDPTFIAWDKCNTYVVAWINLSLSTEIAQSVAWNEIAVDLWVDLKHRYYHGDLFKIAELEEKLYTMNLGDLTITGYYTKMKAVWEEIESFQPVPKCKDCNKECDCGLQIMRNYRRENYAWPIQCTILTTMFLEDEDEEDEQGELEEVVEGAHLRHVHIVIRHIRPILVKLPNGTQTIARISGTMSQNSLKMIGTVRAKRGLYMMHSPSQLGIPTLETVDTKHLGHSLHTVNNSAYVTLAPRRSTRIRKPPNYLQDYHCMLVDTGCSNIQSCSRKYGLSQMVDYGWLSPIHRAFSLAITTTVEPKTYEQAVVHECWRNTISAELLALEKNKTWKITSLPPGKRAIGCKWVFKVKFNPDGSVERHKARLVARGFSQQAGYDYFDTFSPVVKLTTLRLLLTLVAAKGWELHQLDVNTTFLHGELQEVYMLPPQGLVVPNSAVCRLDKSLYGLKQASRQWNLRLSGFLQQHDFIKSSHDHSFFTKHTNNGLAVILVYVDDLILFGDNMVEIETIKKALDAEFSIKDLGKLKFFLGMEVARSSQGIALYQRKYTLDLLEEYGMLEAKPASVPMLYNGKISKENGTKLVDLTCFRRLLGRLLYLTSTRPDIAFSVRKLSQFLDCATDEHYKATLHILRYIKQAPAKGLFFSCQNTLRLFGFVDSD